MTTTDRHLTIWQGENKTITVSLTDADGNDYGSTSGLTFYYWVSSDKNATDYEIEKYTGSGITNGTSQITIALDKADTSGLSPGSYYHECRVIDGSSNEDVVFTGGFIVKPSPTVNYTP